MSKNSSQLQFWEDVDPGAEATVGPCTIGADVLERLVALSLEYFPVHVDDAFAAATPMQRRVLPGTFVEEFVSARVDEALGPFAGSRLHSAHFDYLAPVHPDEPFTIKARVTGKEPVDRRHGLIDIWRQLSAQSGRVLGIGRLRQIVLRRP